MAPATTSAEGARPLVGIAAWLEHVKLSNMLDEPLAFVEATFVAKLSEVGAEVIVVPIQEEFPERAVRRLDGVVIVGGPDVRSPEPRPELGRRDEFELKIAEFALAEGIPVLGVCRGCQVLNVVAGGTLVPEVKEAYEGVVHTYWEPDHKERVDFARHRVDAAPDSAIGRALGPSFEVLSSHHQAVADLAPRFRPIANSEDGLLEAFEDPAHPFAVGIQWHPEAGDDPRIFAALVEAARARQARREKELV